MSKVVILQHAPYAGPGRIVPLFRDYGIPLEVRKLHQGDAVPADLDEVRAIISLGGPMRVADVGSEKFPYLAAEVETLKRMIADDRPVLGIALGAQLLAYAAGAKVSPNVKADGTPAPEYGWGPVSFPFPGGTEPMVMGLIDGAPMFHWHADTFELPKLPPPPNPVPPPAPPPPTGNSLLSSSKLCRNQAFRFRSRLFGFQYHVEFTREQIEALVSADKATAEGALGADAVGRIQADTAKHYDRHARLGNKILENFVEFLKLN